MRDILSVEFKSSFFNLRFFFGVFLLFLSSLIAGQQYAHQLIESGNSAEGAVWLAVYRYCITAENALLFVPIAAPLAAGGNAQTELKSRFSLFCISRTGKKPYLFGKAIGAAVSGGLMVCLAQGILLGVICVWMRDTPVIDGSGMGAASMVSIIILSFLSGFLNGALWALVGSLFAVVTRNRNLAYAAPFIIYYVLTVFQKRYYRNLFFLSPRYWAAPVYYSHVFCIGILMACSLAAAGLFMWVVKRRLEHA